MIEGLIGVGVGIVVGAFLATVYYDAFDKSHLSKCVSSVNVSSLWCKGAIRLRLDREYYDLSKQSVKLLRKYLKKHSEE